MTTGALTLPRIVPRPKSNTGIWSWIGTVDHKRIGTLYFFTSIFWFMIGGTEALIMRVQLARPESGLVSPEVFNQLFTMHGTLMVFLVVMPLSAAFFNWLVPLQIGARDVAFPRLNAFSYWLFLFGSLLLNTSWLVGDAPNGGWFGYAPNSGTLYNPSNGMTFWVISLGVLGVASIAAGLNFIVTIINLRAPGMSMFKMPVFTWMTMITSVLIVLALPVLAVAGIQLQADRLFSMNFYNPVNGGDPVLWQHMFWLFGHPEVYILILPAMGIVSEILPVFSREAIVRVPVCHLCGHRHCVHGLVRLEPSHVHGGPWPGGQLGICHIDHGDRHSNRRQGLELACDDVGRVASDLPRRCYLRWASSACSRSAV